VKTCEKCHLRYPNESTFCFVDGSPLVALQDPRVGSTIAGRYVIEEVIGEGGMATVYRARYKMLDRPCAVKIMNPGLSRDPVVRERFRREAKAAQKLSHPNIIEIIDEGDTDDGTAYLVMELLEGEPLSYTITQGALGLVRALPIMVQIARALARAHDFEVIHRDMKPDNIFLCQRSDGTDLVKLLDFGIARSLQDARLTNQGEVFGTPQYMAPERITSIHAGASSDLYAVGVIFFEMLTGELPFDAPDIPTFFLKHMRSPVPSVRERLPEVPATLDRLITSLMAKDPKQRPVDAHRMHADLIGICTELHVPVPPEPEEEESPTSSSAAKSLSPVAIDRWARRTHIFQQMLDRAYASGAPKELASLLDDIRRHVTKVAALRSDSVAEQRKIEALQSRGKEGRQRIGFAVDALGIDASKARDDARGAREAATPLGETAKAAKEGFLAAHTDIVFWEGRSAFAEPHAKLRDAYKEGAERVDRWLDARRAEQAGTKNADEKDRVVKDLEFQIHELRAALARLEQDVEAELDESSRKIGDLDAQTEALQTELLTIATRFCTPLRRRPELGSLFQELEADAAAA
jgi:serine/threonine-protein kinase